MRLRKYWMLVTLVSMIVILLSGKLLAYDMAEYFPLNQGDEWTFSFSMTVEGGDEEGEYGPMFSKHAVNGTEVINGVETVKVEMRTPASSQTSDCYCYTFDSEGLKEYKEYIVNYLGVINVFEEGILMIPAQLDLGEVHQQTATFKGYDADGNFISTDTGTITISIESVEDVSTPAGTFQDCLKLRRIQTNGSLTFRREAHDWHDRDVGVVKMTATDYFNIPEEDEVIVTMTSELVRATVNGVSYGRCPAVFTLGEDSNDLNTLREFRDEVLGKTPAGQEIIRLYYALSPVIVSAMVEDNEFKEEVKEMIEEFLPVVRKAVK